MNKAVFQSEIKGFRIKIKTVQSGKYLITKDASSFTFDPEHKIYITFTKEEMLKLNGATTLSHLTRSYIYTVTGLSGITNIVTPMVDYTKLLDI